MTVRLPITNTLGNDIAFEAAAQPLMPMRILVVDDEQSVAMSLGRLLAERGHDVSTAADGNTGLRLYRQQAFDLVITDVIMPGMSGATFVERLKLYDANARVLVMTGQPGEPQVEQMLRLGALGVVAKPFELDELLATIARSAYSRAVAV